MLIILEGPDGAGKTTLAAALARVIKAREPRSVVRIMHAGPPKAHPLAEYEGLLLDYRPGQNVHVVCDRWHLGEVVYPLVLDRSTRMTPDVRAHVELFLLSRGALLVHVTALPEVLAERVQTRGDDMVTPAQALRAANLFANELRDTLLPMREVVPPLSERQICALVEAALQLEAAYAHLVDHPMYVGPRYPELLLLGEKRGPGAHASRRDWPAFVPAPGTSGRYLLSSLLAFDSRALHSLGISNACDPGEDGEELWKLLGEPTVVALGQRACAAALRWAPVVRAVPHPQWVRRFRHARGDDYAAAILGEKVTEWN